MSVCRKGGQAPARRATAATELSDYAAAAADVLLSGS